MGLLINNCSFFPASLTISFLISEVPGMSPAPVKCGDIGAKGVNHLYQNITGLFSFTFKKRDPLAMCHGPSKHPFKTQIQEVSENLLPLHKRIKH